MEASPTTPFVVAQPEVLLQVLVVALDAPALMRCADQLVSGVLSGSVDRQYLLGSASSAGHSMSSHCCGRSRALPALPPA